MSRTARLALTLTLVTLLAGCALALRSPRIGELRNNPARYYNKTVSVDGVVTSSWGIPLLPYRLYKIDDGSGELTVVAQGGRIPTKGSRVRVKGKVNELATFGGTAIGLHLQQQSLHVKGGSGY
ncbi:MAG TPA: hypothetical protein VK886_13715 [Vicinamibacterales bacterium]|nr:hypothetical protein [Vicinamibacterales bacterium]